MNAAEFVKDVANKAKTTSRKNSKATSDSQAMPTPSNLFKKVRAPLVLDGCMLWDVRTPAIHLLDSNLQMMYSN